MIKPRYGGLPRLGRGLPGRRSGHQRGQLPAEVHLLLGQQRYAGRVGATARLRICAVGRTRAELPYADELLAAGAFVALTRENLGDRVAAPPYPSELEPLLDGVERAYVCGSVGFASFAVRLLGELGVPTDTIRVEQFGATG